jgi:prostaglandin-endoperoxide synthase 2
MASLSKFKQLMADGKKEAANKCLRNAIDNHRETFFNDLRKDEKPILKFWSYHPGNPDITVIKNEQKPGFAYILSGWDDVKYALENFSMESYERVSPAGKGSFILSEDKPAIHDPRHDALTAALSDPFLSEKMDAAIEESWQKFAGYKPLSDRFDIRVFARTVALRFTGKFFGIDEKYIFGGDETLEKWSEIGYENFIWKLHGRHFGDQNPEMNGALLKIVNIVQVSMRIESVKLAKGYVEASSSVISRLIVAGKRGDNTFENVSILIANIVGLIQGLVDNVMTGTCYALNQMYQKSDSDFQAIRALRFDTDKLKEKVLVMHQADTPSPFLPRRGTLGALPSFDAKKYPDENPKKEVIFSCAIGSAISDNIGNSNITDDWDIRMGSGMHACIGNYIGDDITTRMIAKILEINPVVITSPLNKRWGWVVKNFEIRNNRILNYMAVNKFTTNAMNRPAPFSLKSPYTSWSSLTDKTYFSRHLGPANTDAVMKPTIEELIVLFDRDSDSNPGNFKPGRSSVLFAFFAQWLTDSFLRTDTRNVKDSANNSTFNTSTHELDMCQIYGISNETTKALRKQPDPDNKQYGKLKTEKVKHDDLDYEVEFLPRLYENDQATVKGEFEEIPYIKDEQHEKLFDIIRDDLKGKGYTVQQIEAHLAKIKKNYFATGLERGNSTIGYTALSTLFVLEHNRICDEIFKEIEELEPDTTTANLDERVFQTARMIIIALELKIIIEEYINHITSSNKEDRVFLFDQSFAENQKWYRENWISIEFDLLYRWHSLIPDKFEIGNASPIPFADLLGDNDLLIKYGYEAILHSASGQPAGKITLRNTPKFLLQADKATLARSRNHNLRPYNEYRKHFGLAEINSFEDLRADGEDIDALKILYDDNVENLDLIVGLYAEEAKEPANGLFGELMTRMVAYNAFTHALTNPLLSNNVWGPDTFTNSGMKIIEGTHCLEDIVRRNSNRDDRERLHISMDAPSVN